MANSIEIIKAPIEAELETFETKFKDAMRSKVSLLDRVMHYVVQRKGKQMRPMFVFHTAKMIAPVQEATYVGASMIELLHTATLVHDDVVDDSNTRRGAFSINAIWKNKIAVLIGDYLLGKSLLVAVDGEHFSLLKILSDTVKDMSEGEMLQIEKARRLDIDESVYFEIIRQKTASLISSACGIGAASVTEDKHQIQEARLLGEKIGMAFQIKDDLFDYGESEIGKPRGIDIKERKMTLPLIYALNQANKKDKKWLINSVKNHNENKKRVKEVIAYVRKSGGIEYTEQKMMQYKTEAEQILAQFPENENRKGLQNLLDFTIARKH